MIKFERNALGNGVPENDTFVTACHLIVDAAKDKLRLARKFCEDYPKVNKVRLNRVNVYNIVLENDNTLINVNGLICETLKHTNPAAKSYLKN